MGPLHIYEGNPNNPQCLRCDLNQGQGLHRGNQVNTRSLEGALNYHDSCPQKEEEFGHRHGQEEDNTRTPGEGSDPQAEEKNLEHLLPSQLSE